MVFQRAAFKTFRILVESSKEEMYASRYAIVLRTCSLLDSFIFHLALQKLLRHSPVSISIPSLILRKHILELLDHLVRQRNCRKSFQSLHVHFLCQNLAISNQLLQIFKVAHEEARCDCVDKDSFFVERVAKLVWQADRYGDKVASAGIEMAASWGMESNFPFLCSCQHNICINMAK